ncbi:hypothetical protein [Pseudomonas protegens]|uniref:hypothetical protein n=1 Tax=Pseudomonas protegens TaxID=380021 RepID=UPI0034D3FEB1
MGFALDWQELPNAMACRIATWYPDAPIEDEGRWDEYLDVAHATTGNDGPSAKTYCQSLTVTRPSHLHDPLLPH